jgi:hypothetical protein
LLRLPKEDQDKLENAISNVDSLKSKVKKDMALTRVIDLSKLRE